MKFTFMFLLVLVLTASRRLKKKKPFDFKSEQLTYLANGEFGIVMEGILSGQNEAKFVIKYPLTQEVVNDLNLTRLQGTQFKTKADDYFKEEVKVMNYLKQLKLIKEFKNIFSIHQAQQKSENYLNNKLRLKINKAVISPFGYKLNSDDKKIVLIKYDCNLLDFVYEHKNRCNFKQVGRLIQYKMIRAIFFLQKHKVLHRDIKLENFMIKVDANKVTACKDIHLSDMLNKDFTVAIIDFGLAIVNPKNIKEARGTTVFLAPEVYYWKQQITRFDFKDVYSEGYGLSADVYSLGLALLDVESKLELRDFKDRFRFDGILEHINQVLEKNKSELSNVLKMMLNLNPKQRISIEEVVKWFANLDERETFVTKEKKPYRPLKSVLKGLMNLISDE